jgi:hypothetical protein
MSFWKSIRLEASLLSDVRLDRDSRLASWSSADPHSTGLDYCETTSQPFTKLRHCFDHGCRFGAAHAAVELHENDAGLWLPTSIDELAEISILGD